MSAPPKERKKKKSCQGAWTISIGISVAIGHWKLRFNRSSFTRRYVYRDTRGDTCPTVKRRKTLCTCNTYLFNVIAGCWSFVSSFKEIFLREIRVFERRSSVKNRTRSKLRSLLRTPSPSQAEPFKLYFLSIYAINIRCWEEEKIYFGELVYQWQMT